MITNLTYCIAEKPQFFTVDYFLMVAALFTFTDIVNSKKANAPTDSLHPGGL